MSEKKRYTVDELMPKRYPENRPSAKGDYWIIGNGPCGTTKAIWNMFNPDWIERVSWFINIPGAPEEVRPRKYPDEKPEKRYKEYIIHLITEDKWDKLYWDYGWYRRQSTGCLSHVSSDMIDYFINIPLEEEMEKGNMVVWKNVNGVLLINEGDKLLIDTKRGKPTLLFKKEWLEVMEILAERYGYDITKRAPEIAPCPFCNAMCIVEGAYSDTPEFVQGKKQVICTTDVYCGYRGPIADTAEQAIRLHNLIAGKSSKC